MKSAEELKLMSLAELSKYIEEQKALGKNGQTLTNIAELLGVHRTTLNSRIKKFKDKGEQKGDMSEQIITNENSEVQEGTEIQTKEKVGEPKQEKEKMSTRKHNDFTDDEIQVLKQLIAERKLDYKLFEEYRVYEELSKVPIGVEMVRSAFNMSKDTTERLKKYASERRLPLQDLVELAVINLLEQYEKK